LAAGIGLRRMPEGLPRPVVGLEHARP
jgi:hypothetical protein